MERWSVIVNSLADICKSPTVASVMDSTKLSKLSYSTLQSNVERNYIYVQFVLKINSESTDIILITATNLSKGNTYQQRPLESNHLKNIQKAQLDS